MIRTLLRRAALALQRASEARSIDNRWHYAEEARRAFEAARQSAAWLAAEDGRGGAIDLAARAGALAARELAEFEARLDALEAELARHEGGGG